MVMVKSTKLALELLTNFVWYTILEFSRPLRPTQPGIPPWVGGMSIGDGFGHHWGRNDEFCIVLPLTELLAYWLKLVKVAGC